MMKRRVGGWVGGEGAGLPPHFSGGWEVGIGGGRGVGGAKKLSGGWGGGWGMGGGRGGP